MSGKGPRCEASGDWAISASGFRVFGTKTNKTAWAVRWTLGARKANWPGAREEAQRLRFHLCEGKGLKVRGKRSRG